jgi:hypothetical protein
MADAEDLSYLSTLGGNSNVNGVKVGELLTGNADDNAELRLICNLNQQSVETRRLPPKHHF